MAVIPECFNRGSPTEDFGDDGLQEKTLRQSHSLPSTTTAFAAVYDDYFVAMKQNHLSFFAWIRSIAGWFLVAVATLIFFPFVLIIVPVLFVFDRNRKHIHPLISLWARTILIVLPLMRVRIEGEHHLKQSSVFVLVANHQSVADIIAVLHLPHPFKFIAKKELFWIPFLGWALTLAGYIPLERGDRLSGKQTVDRAKQYLEEGMSVLFFPEGTRSRDGEIHEFKIGAFKIASELGIPVVPIVIDGTREVVPKGNFMIGSRKEVTVKVGAPLAPFGTSNGDINEFAQQTRRKMIASLEEIRMKKFSGHYT